MNFSRQSPKMFKIASDIFIHAFFVVVFRSFSQNFPFGAPAESDYNRFCGDLF